MKVLYIGNYKDGTGWANACINNILALDAAGVDVVPRAITFNNSAGGCPQKILELEENLLFILTLKTLSLLIVFIIIYYK